MDRRRAKGLVILLLLFESAAYGATLTENFSSADRWDRSQSTLVLNTALQRVHPSLRNKDWSSTNQTTNISVGDGRHGSFSPSRYTSFGTLSNNVLTIDTTQYSELQVTEFILSAGTTLRPTGSNPLIIKSLTSISISGVIDCAGDDGGGVVVGTTTLASGGTARCGGGAGANGGTIAVPAAATGTAGGSFVTGGPGGTVAGVRGQGGSGGGGYSSNVLAGYQATGGQDGSGGFLAIGSNYPDEEFTVVGGGSGGGGGGGGTGSVGAGGGAGGGAIYMYAVQDITLVSTPSSTGEVRADGGDGGAVSGGAAATNGGGGGAGAGGSILMWSGNIVDFGGISGPPYLVTALEGSAAATNGLSGGKGGRGRTWIVDNDDAAPPGYPNGSLDDPISELGADVGRIEFSTDSQILVSQFIDLGTTKPTFNSATLFSTLAGGATATLEVRGSDDGSAGDATAWYSSAQIAQLNGKRFIQMRVTLDNNDPQSYSYVTGITIDYELFEQKNFEMIGACGRVSGVGLLSVLPLLALFFSVFFALRIRFHHS